MEFYKKISLKDGNTCILRNAESSDAEDFLDYFELTHLETNFLTTYPDESTHTVSQMQLIWVIRKPAKQTLRFAHWFMKK